MIQLEAKRNVVLLSFESKRASFFKTFGGSYPSPNMDRLAAQGIKFEKMISPSASTAMALASVLSGQYPYQLPRLDYTGTGFNPDHLFDVMHDRGYRCFFSCYDGFFDDYAPKIYGSEHVEALPIPEEAARSTLAAAMVLDVAQKTDEPFFIVAHCCPDRPCDESVKSEWRNATERYVWEDDIAVGMLLDGLDLDDTRLIVCADHGTMTGEQANLFGHGFFLYEQGIHVPCIISDANPQTIHEPHSLKQVYDLILGHKVSPPQQIVSDTLFVFQPHRITSIRENDWKYIAHYSWQTAVKGLQEELYDLQADPGEQRNLLDDRGHHPLRRSWTFEYAWAEQEDTAYDSGVLADVVTRLRTEMCRIWMEPFLFFFKELLPEHFDGVNQYLSKASPIECMSVIGEMVNVVRGEGAYYEGQPEGAPLPVLPYPHPGLPEQRDFLNYSSFAAIDLRQPRS